MSEGKFSINRACAVGIAFLGLLSIVTIISAYLFVRNPAIVWLCLLFILLVFSCAITMNLVGTPGWPPRVPTKFIVIERRGPVKQKNPFRELSPLEGYPGKVH